MRRALRIGGPITLILALTSAASCGDGGEEGRGADAGGSGPGGASSSDARAPSVDAPSDASTAPMPLRYLVIIVKENHTFDNYFGFYDGGGLTPVRTAALSDGTTIPRPACPSQGIPRDLDHSHAAAVTAFNDGGMNGFDRVPGNVAPKGGAPDYLAYCSFSADDQLPLYSQLADNFALADRFFTTTLAPSFPGHLAAAIGQTPAISNPGCPAGEPTCESTKSAWGCTDAPGTTVPLFDSDTCEPKPAAYPCFDLPTWVDVLPPNVDWAVYGGARGTDASGAPIIWTPFNAVRALGGDPAVRKAHFRDQAQLVADLKAGRQPNIVYWNDMGDGSEHPPSSPCPGEALDARVLDAVMHGPHWNETAVLLSFDDWGGFYDHVAPAVERCKNGLFYHPGFRVPLLIVSPYARKGFVFHGVTEQASLPRLVAEVFRLPFATARDPHARDGTSGSLLGAFDFTQAPLPPIDLATCP